MRAAEYIRMSTDFQRYSTANQQAKIREFALTKGYQIVKSYADEGKSGLHLKGRPGLQSLLADVAKGTNEFQVILVYDVSRWGRFQDLDEGAHYEFICRSAGKPVIYCAEIFESDHSPYSSIVKGLKRVMAGEYSRELSEKVFRGQSTVAALGYRTGARAGYGYRRQLVGPDGVSKGVLAFGERKAQQADKIRLVLGPDDEVTCVLKIFEWFVRERLLYYQIIDRLIAIGAPPPAGCRRWTKHILKNILGNEKYLGTNVYNRASTRLKSPKIANPEASWVRRSGAFPAIVDQQTFEAARVLLKQNPKKRSRQELVDALIRVHECHGRISAQLIDSSAWAPSASTVKAAFGGLEQAYRHIGYIPAVAYGPSAAQAWLCRSNLAAITSWLADELRWLGVSVSRLSEQWLTTSRGISIAVTAITNRSGGRMRFEVRSNSGIQVAVPDNGIADFPWFVVPANRMERKSVDWHRDSFPERLGTYVCQREGVPLLVRECLI